MASEIQDQSPIVMRRAVAIIERFWCQCKKNLMNTSAIAQNYLEQGISKESALEMSLTELSVAVQTIQPFSTLQLFLKRVMYLCDKRHSIQIASVQLKTYSSIDVVRCILNIPLIVYKTSVLFDHMDSLETCVLHVAGILMEHLQKVAKFLQHNVFHEMPNTWTQDFHAQVYNYIVAYNAWRISDDLRKKNRFINALKAMYSTQKYLAETKAGPTAISDFDKQIDMVRNKFKKAFGPKAMLEFDTNILPKCLADEVLQPAIKVKQYGIHPPRYYYYYQMIMIIIMPKIYDLMTHIIVARLDDKQIAHEILLDPMFQFEMDGHYGAKNPFIAYFRQEFWDDVLDDLKAQPPSYVCVLRVLTHIRDIIHTIQKERTRIFQILDLDLINHRLESGTNDWKYSTGLLEDIVTVFDEIQTSQETKNETKIMWQKVQSELHQVNNDIQGQPSAFCQALQFLLNRMIFVRTEIANVRLRKLSKNILLKGVEYEQRHFMEKLSDGSYTLERATVHLFLLFLLFLLMKSTFLTDEIYFSY